MISVTDSCDSMFVGFPNTDEGRMSSLDLESQLTILLKRAVEEEDRAKLETLLEQINRLLKAREKSKPGSSE